MKLDRHRKIGAPILRLKEIGVGDQLTRNARDEDSVRVISHKIHGLDLTLNEIDEL